MIVTVYGKPIPKGSFVYSEKKKSAFYANQKELNAWDLQIRKVFASRLRKDEMPIYKEGAVSIMLRFAMLKPKSAKREYPSVRPDLDKLSRAVLDALHGIVFKDDGQVIRLTAEKYYAKTPEDQGVTIIYNRFYPGRYGDGTF